MPLKPIDGVIAIPPSESEHITGLPQGKELAGDELDQFRNVGWRFIATSEPAELARNPVAAEFHPLDPPNKVAKGGVVKTSGLHPRRVYSDDAGHVVIEGAAVVVRFRSSVEPDRAASLLDEHGLRVKRKLGFVPNGYQAVPLDPGVNIDLLQVAERLQNLTEVEYAEPATVEMLKDR